MEARSRPAKRKMLPAKLKILYNSEPEAISHLAAWKLEVFRYLNFALEPRTEIKFFSVLLLNEILFQLCFLSSQKYCFLVVVFVSFRQPGSGSHHVNIVFKDSSLFLGCLNVEILVCLVSWVDKAYTPIGCWTSIPFISVTSLSKVSARTGLKIC